MNKLISPRPQDYRKKVDLGTRVMQPIANTVVDYGKLLATSAVSTPLSLGSYLALKANQPKLAGNLAQGAINIRNSAGYNQGGVNDLTKGLGVTARAIGTTYGLANVPKMVTNVAKSLTSVPSRQIIKQVPQAINRRVPVQEMVTKNGRDFFLKGRTPTYELNMPTRVFSR